MASSGFILQLVRSGVEALHELSRFKPDLILMDVVMPDMDGYETCQLIREDPRYADLPVIFMTALDDAGSKVRGFEAGGVDYITKPFDEEELRARLRTHLHILRLRRQLREEIMAKDRALVELEAFSHTVAHDLKNPLAGIVGLAEHLTSMEEAADCARTIKEAGEQCTRIIEEILVFSSIRGESVKLREVDMTACLEKALTSLSWLMGERDAHLVYRPEVLPPALGHASWVVQVWMNFLSNAAIYGGPSARVSVGCRVEEGHNRYWVEDQGKGIADGEKALLFLPFSRLDQVKLQGTGLGLSIVRRIIDRLGGEVGVDDVEGGGARFHFTLPGTLHA